MSQKHICTLLIDLKEIKNLTCNSPSLRHQAVSDPRSPGPKSWMWVSLTIFPWQNFIVKLFFFAVLGIQFLAFVCCDSLALHTNLSDVCGQSQHDFFIRSNLRFSDQSDQLLRTFSTLPVPKRRKQVHSFYNDITKLFIEVWSHIWITKQCNCWTIW